MIHSSSAKPVCSWMTVLFLAAFAGFVMSGCKKDTPSSPDSRTNTTKQASVNFDAGDAAAGKDLYTTKGCLACHSLDGTKRIGPSFKGLFGSQRTVITAGKERTVVADVNYMVLSIKDPKADVVKGYETQLMTVVPTSDKEIADLIAYLKTLK